MLKGNKLMGLLVVLMLLVGVYFILQYQGKGDRSKSYRDQLVSIDTAAITKVQLIASGDTTELIRKHNEWSVVGKPADVNSIKALFNNLNTIKPSRLASRSEDTWADFQVDDQGTRVIIHEGSDKSLDIVLGKFNVEGQRSYYSYVRLADEKDVYVANNFMKMTVGTSSADYRNDDILRLNKDSVSSIEFNYPDSGFVLQKADQGWLIGSELADSAAVASYLQAVSFVSSRSFEDINGEAAISDVIYHLTNGEDVQITRYEEDKVSSSQNTDEAWKGATAAKKIFIGKGEFLK